MKQIRYLLLAVILLGAGAVIFAVSRPDANASEPVAVETPKPATSVSAAPPVGSANSVARVSASKTTEQWIVEASSGDAKTRAAAITALAEAPRAEALPVLSRLLIDGEPLVDRPLALTSLREIALNQGDADGAIRDAVRHVIYHGDDFTKLDDAQDTLDIIEESLMRQ